MQLKIVKESYKIDKNSQNGLIIKDGGNINFLVLAIFTNLHILYYHYYYYQVNANKYHKTPDKKFKVELHFRMCVFNTLKHQNTIFSYESYQLFLFLNL